MTWPYRENVLDLEPHGPLPSQIYWRRRALAIGIAVLVVAIVAGDGLRVVFSGTGAETPTSNRRRPQRRATDSRAEPEVKTPVVPPAAAGSAPDPDPDRGRRAAAGAQGGRRLPGLDAGGQGHHQRARSTSIGDQPKFTMVVTNIGLVACKRDVGAAVLAAYVYSLDNKRLWSNLDCAPSNETLVKTFNPGEQVTTEVTWTGMGSAPQCPLPRQPIGPGTYNLVVQLGNLRSATVPFIAGRRARRRRAEPAAAPPRRPAPEPAARLPAG